MKNYLLVLLVAASLTAEAQWSRSTASPFFIYPTTTGDRVGIGYYTNSTSFTPLSKLEVTGDQTPSTSDLVTFSMYDNTYNPTLRFYRTRGSRTAMSDVSSGDVVGNIFGSARINSALRDVASIRFVMGTSPGSTSYPGNILFNTVGAGTTTLAERMRITDAGNVGIGTATPGYKLDVAGFVNATKFYLNGVEMVASQWSDASGSVFRSTGNVGIGVASPAEKLHIGGGNILFDNGTTPTIFTGTGSVELLRYMHIANSSGLATPSGFKAGGVLIADSYSYANPGKNDLVVKGRILIGTAQLSGSNPFMLAVNGKIGAKDLQISNNSPAWTWPDYVFSDDYKLPSLQEVERFIKENKHLKDVPSAETVAKEGYSVDEMNQIMLKKIEELTLYVIQQQKEIDALKKELAEKK